MSSYTWIITVLILMFSCIFLAACNSHSASKQATGSLYCVGMCELILKNNRSESTTQKIEGDGEKGDDVVVESKLSEQTGMNSIEETTGERQ